MGCRGSLVRIQSPRPIRWTRRKPYGCPCCLVPGRFSLHLLEGRLTHENRRHPLPCWEELVRAGRAHPSPDERQRRQVRERQQKLRKKHRRVDILFKDQDYEKIKRASKRYKGLAPFVRDCVLAYIDKKFLTPTDETARLLELGIRRIGNNINQIARRVNTQKMAYPADIDDLYKSVVELEDTISEVFRNPPELVDLIKKRLNEAPEFTEQLQTLIDHNREENGVH